jgi:phosphorylcholine metabolism protein LicD
MMMTTKKDTINFVSNTTKTRTHQVVLTIAIMEGQVTEEKKVMTKAQKHMRERQTTRKQKESFNSGRKSSRGQGKAQFWNIRCSGTRASGLFQI